MSRLLPDFPASEPSWPRPQVAPRAATNRPTDRSAYHVVSRGVLADRRCRVCTGTGRDVTRWCACTIGSLDALLMSAEQLRDRADRIWCELVRTRDTSPYPQMAGLEYGAHRCLVHALARHLRDYRLPARVVAGPRREAGRDVPSIAIDTVHGTVRAEVSRWSTVRLHRTDGTLWRWSIPLIAAGRPDVKDAAVRIMTRVPELDDPKAPWVWVVAKVNRREPGGRQPTPALDQVTFVDPDEQCTHPANTPVSDCCAGARARVLWRSLRRAEGARRIVIGMFPVYNNNHGTTLPNVAYLAALEVSRGALHIAFS